MKILEREKNKKLENIAKVGLGYSWLLFVTGVWVQLAASRDQRLGTAGCQS
jgi:hypothetical protein